MFGISAFAESPFASLAGLAGNVNVSLTGQSATGSVGTTTFVCVAHINPTGQEATSAVGGIGITAGGDIGVTGFAITSGLGSMTITGESNLTIDFSSQGATSTLSGVGVNAPSCSNFT